MKFILIIGICLSLSFLLEGCSNNNSNFTEQQNNSQVSEENNVLNLNNKGESSKYNENNNPKEEEVEIASFTTPLTSGNPNRITNIKITCGKINNYILKNGETFSFNEVVGPCTAEEGYLEAEIYVNKKIKSALGGGNCQVSTTLYNACLQVPEITIIERHEHQMPVDYIENGKDATISYGTLDFSFRNDTGSDLILLANCDDVNVSAKIIKKSK